VRFLSFKMQLFLFVLFSCCVNYPNRNTTIREKRYNQQVKDCAARDSECFQSELGQHTVRDVRMRTRYHEMAEL